MPHPPQVRSPYRSNPPRVIRRGAHLAAGAALLMAGYVVGESAAPGPDTAIVHRLGPSSVLGYPIVQAYLMSVDTAISDNLAAFEGAALPGAKVAATADKIADDAVEFFDEYELESLKTPTWKNISSGDLIPADPATSMTLSSFLSDPVIADLHAQTEQRMLALLTQLSASGRTVDDRAIYGIALDGAGGAASDIECWECIWGTTSPDGRWFNVCTGEWGGPS